ncbi:hypothetical protein FDP41_013191 [Naegleria fowleri]|uniref:Uncharacterized protein n=1 Tax=Naegleria fowleri TaxID=5763 RepID=A0A6A5C4B5_NAEFO|nr:uncharacterized protein FDP41_013191 [Naegleria fowleri]KAF0980708.1 hypothetical protein FDP41_013191 [Naegleria fowleri]
MSEQSPHENIESLKADNASIDKEDQLNQNSFPIKDPMIVDDKEEIQPTQETADHSQRQTQSNLIIIEVERKFQDSKDVILDMIHEITHLQREQELAKYHEMCNKESSKPSVTEVASLSSLVRKHELEREKMENQYKERIKEVSNERDLLMRESLETKLHLEANMSIVEKIKLIANLSGYHQEKEKYENTLEKVNLEMELLLSKVKTFEENASVMTSEQENTRLRVEMLEKLLTKTMEENAKLYDENMSLRKHLAQ